MYFFENPVLQRELVINLRMTRSFVLLFAYVALLGMLVYAAWPVQQKLDMAQPEAAQRLVSLFFLGQYLLMSLMTPSFAAGAITGEKERKSYEMLVASPLTPGAVVLGKIGASLVPLAILMVCSLPIVMLCLPLGGVSPYEVFAAFFAMLASVCLFGMISLWCSSYFVRTSAALVVSYLLILPLAMSSVFAWLQLEGLGEARLLITVTVIPLMCGTVIALLWGDICKRLLRPPDLGSGGKQVVDLESEAQEAVGLYIDREEFPDRLFAPPKRTTFLPDAANPIYDKEIRSEIFSQGTLMLRLVIQISMGVALPVMALCLFLKQQLAPWYIAYVLFFNLLVGPVFTAGSVTSERERQTLDLLLTTLITPWQMLWGKLLAGLRVSGVLTAFLMWPVLLACLMPLAYWHNLPTMAGYLLIVAFSTLTTAMVGLFFSTLFYKTSTSQMATYLVLATLYVVPVATQFFTQTFMPGTRTEEKLAWSGVLSPLAAAFNLPLEVEEVPLQAAMPGNSRPAPMKAEVNVMIFWGYLAVAVLLNGLLLLMMRWRGMGSEDLGARV
jgi:ABC-type transport system involved in multi-copper enzyme maturation permease subunit